MSNRTFFSLRIDSLKPQQQEDDALTLINYEENTLNDIVNSALEKHKLKADNPFNLSIKNGVLYVEGVAHTVSDFNFSFV